MDLFKKKEPYVPKTGITGIGDDYNVYEMTMASKIIWFAIGAAIGSVVGWIFYENIILCIIVAIIVGLILIPVRHKSVIEKRKAKLLLQFKDMLSSLSTSIGAGSNVVDAFLAAEHDMKIQYSEDSDIVKELMIINAGLNKANLNIEDLLVDFGNRSDLPDVMSFANVFDTCYRKGGDIREVLKNTYQILCDKIEISLEIKTMVSSKTSEQNIMLIMPVAFVFLLKQMGSDVINLTSTTGRLSTTVAIAIFAVSYMVGKKILDIKV